MYPSFNPATLPSRDNNEAETRRAEPVILKELAEQLCKVPQSQVRTVRIENRSSAVNTETWVRDQLPAGGVYIHQLFFL
jgi:hypothetical protein